MTVELSVLVPCFNEEGNLPELVERILRVFERRRISGEIVLVNDGSRDRTGAVIDALAARHPNVVGVHHPTNRGIPGGWTSGFQHSRGRYVCTIDADLQYQPEAIAQLYREMAFTKADLVQGWRSSLERHSYDIRYYMSRGLDYLLKLAFGMHEHDVKSGFVIYKREVFESILQDAPDYFYFQHMITVLAKARGYSLRQVETLFEERRAGQSFIGRFPGKMIARTLADIGHAVVALRLREPKDQSLAVILGSRPQAGRQVEPPRRARAERLYASLMGLHHPTLSHNPPRYLEELRVTQWLPREEIEQLQLRRLRRQIAHAHDHVGYWREVLQAAGVTPDDVRTLDDVHRVPVLTKESLRDNIYFDLLSDNNDKRKIRKIVTCGATGEPLAVFVDRLQLDMRWANTARGAEWTGYRLGNPRARLDARVPIDPDRLGAVAERIDAVLTSRASLAIFPFDDVALRRFVERLRHHAPALLDGDAEAFTLIACLLAARGDAPLAARAILTAGQTLTPESRALIERQLGARVFDRYSSGEFGAIAQQCEAASGYHVNAESYLVEVLRDGRPAADGEEGEVVVTDLTNRCVPLLRYALGDRAVTSSRPCPCGRQLPLLERVSGRPQAVLSGTGGRWIPASFFARLFEGYEYAVRRYQVLQNDAGRVDLRIVRRSRFTAETERDIRVALDRVLGAEVTIGIEFVEPSALVAGELTPTCVARLAPVGFPITEVRAAAPSARLRVGH
jgi:phenylacetate-CoA ligase